MIDFSLAARNLLRNRRRSFATFIALVIGTSSILFFGGYRKNIEYTMQTAYVREDGHLQIQHRDLYLYGSGNAVKYSIVDYQRIIDAIKSDEVLGKMTAVVSPALQFGGIASNFPAGVSRTVLGVGTVAADKNRMRSWNEFALPLQAPNFALEGSAPDSAIVGHGVARVLMLCDVLGIADCPKPVVEAKVAGEALPADIAGLAKLDMPVVEASTTARPRIELLANSAGGAPNVVSLQILRAERQGFKELDEVYLMLQLSEAQRLVYGRGNPKVTAIMVQLHKSANTPVAKARLQELLLRVAPQQPLAVLDFREMNPFFVQTLQMFDAIFGFIFLLIASIVLFTVGNTMSTAVMERTVEIGTLRAMGLRRLGVQRLFVTEGTLLGVAGAGVGAMVAILGSAAVNHLGLTWLPPGSAQPLPLLMRVWGETFTIVGTTFGLMAIAAFSAWWPARRASRLVVVDALRHV
ncbi:MAG: FtsX-like permease family protein [Rubrivivax sp.]